MTYDIKFRERAIAFKESGAAFAQLKAIFGVDRKTCIAWIKQRQETGTLAPDKSPQVRKGKIDKERLKQAIKENPDAYLEELAKLFGCTPQAVFYSLKKMKITFKKKTFTYSEKSEEKRKNS